MKTFSVRFRDDMPELVKASYPRSACNRAFPSVGGFSWEEASGKPHDVQVEDTEGGVWYFRRVDKGIVDAPAG